MISLTLIKNKKFKIENRPLKKLNVEKQRY